MIKTISSSWLICFNQNYHWYPNFSKSVTCPFPILCHLLQLKRLLGWEICLFFAPKWASNRPPSFMIFEGSFSLVCNHLPPGNNLAHNSSISRRYSGVIFLQLWHPLVAWPLIFYHHLKLIHFQNLKFDIVPQSVTQQILFYIYYIVNTLIYTLRTQWKYIMVFALQGSSSFLPTVLHFPSY